MKVQVAFDSADPNALADFWGDQLVADGRMPASDRLVNDGSAC